MHFEVTFKQFPPKPSREQELLDILYALEGLNGCLSDVRKDGQGALREVESGLLHVLQVRYLAGSGLTGEIRQQLLSIPEKG